MSLYQTMAEAITAGQKKDLERFTQYIDLSISIVEGLGGPKSDNQKIYQQMKKELERLKNTKIGTESLDAILNNLEQYQELMSNVDLSFSANARAKKLDNYKTSQDYRNAQTMKYLTKNSPNEEE